MLQSQIEIWWQRWNYWQEIFLKTTSDCSSCAPLTTIIEVQNPLRNILRLQIRVVAGYQLETCWPEIRSRSNHDRDQGRLKENAVQSCEGAPREASGQEGTTRGALFFFVPRKYPKSCSLLKISLGIEESGQNLDIIPQVKRKEALAAASSLTTALVDHLNVGVAQVSFQ